MNKENHNQYNNNFYKYYVVFLMLTMIHSDLHKYDSQTLEDIHRMLSAVYRICPMTTVLHCPPTLEEMNQMPEEMKEEFVELVNKYNEL